MVKCEETLITHSLLDCNTEKSVEQYQEEKTRQGSLSITDNIHPQLLLHLGGPKHEEGYILHMVPKTEIMSTT